MRAALAKPPSGAGEHSTKWVEQNLDLSDVDATPAAPPADEQTEPLVERSTTVEVNGKRVEVKLPGGFGGGRPAAKSKAKPTKRDRGGAKVAAPSGNSLTSPMQGTIVKVNVEEGQQVAEGDAIAVIEAMKMEQPLNAHRDGVIVGLKVEAGQAVTAGEVLCEIVDAE